MSRNSQSRAHKRVREAIKRGKLARLDGSIMCLDCGKTAKVYDHRDYDKPLDVDPVCQSCNMKRGHGENRVIPGVTTRIATKAQEQ